MSFTKRALAKAITWRIVASMITAAIVYAALIWNGVGATSALRLGGVAALADSAVKIVLFVLHDELWHRYAPRDERS